jgi:hypothetical protein
MALNVPSGDKNRMTFGPGILYVDADPLATPTTDVGYARGCTVTITRQKMDVFQGSPRSLIETYAIQEDVALNFTGLEWNPTNLSLALGSGATSTSGSTEILEFGGEVTFTEVALRFIHNTPTSGTVDIKIWKAQGVGEFNINFGDDLQEHAYNFRALEALTDWEGAALATNKRLIKIDFTPGA